MDKKRCYSIREVSEKTDLSAHVLRYYEKEGLLPEIHRTKGGVRYYTDEDLDLLGLICCLKKTGMPLKEIKTFVDLSCLGPQTLAQRCDILEAQRLSVEENIAAMQKNYEKVLCKLDHFKTLLREYEDTQAAK